MLHLHTPRIAVRPTQPLQLLALVGFLAIGIISAGQLYGRSAWLFVAAYVALSLGFLADKIVFDGTHLRRTGPGAWLFSLLGQPAQLSLDDIEALTSDALPTASGQLTFRTSIHGPDVKWVIRANQRQYATFIKALFKAVHPHHLDQLSTELLLYWEEPDPPFKLVRDQVINAYRIERWRRKAINLSFRGEAQAAATYFKLAHENSPHDPQIAYDIGRFLRRRALASGQHSEQGVADLFRAETYFRMAGRLAWEKKNARLLERVGEAFLEFQQFEPAKKYFLRATKLEPVRPRANISLAGIALQECQGARAVHAFNQAVAGAEAGGIHGLSNYARRKSEYFERLMRDIDFLSKEAGWDGVLTQLRWARRGALLCFLLTWMVHLTSLPVAAPLREVSLEVSATALIVWVCALTASHVILAWRRSE